MNDENRKKMVVEVTAEDLIECIRALRYRAMLDRRHAGQLNLFTSHLDDDLAMKLEGLLP